MAPMTRCQERALEAPAPSIDPADRLSKLPDEVLAQILSFLPAQEAVQTCVLGRTWRNLWKMTRRLFINGDPVHEVRKFVDGLLRARLDGLELAPLDACDLALDPIETEDCDEYTYRAFDGTVDLILDDKETSAVNFWIRRVLKCQIKELWVYRGYSMNLDAYLHMSKRPLVSRHLTRLELQGVMFRCRLLNFSRCPALEHLEIRCCCLPYVEKITSPSLKRLVISLCETTQDNFCSIRISVPRLVSLWVDQVYDWTPLLESMPDLVGAHVEIRSSNLHSNGNAQDATKCYLLQGLAKAKDLEMIANSDSKYIFVSDLRWCPTSSKLKTLVLNDELCEPADCTLACILEHAPFLEKLTVIISHQPRDKNKVEVKGRLDETVKSRMISQHLKVVKVKCERIDERVLNILKFLGTLNICFQIRVTGE